ncbi:GNAT family N-acetyltransferase [Aspergillus clavatus NRRL 1]|uniref:GNAT family acetyltransferase, putative n=1 Tax=Aspergillus clavatus (strain ATCC 1007 / CBS 513.65 / DSM 816 / NCTC 3887 / NRRL 1 / QM 1276 / 107) TaxID=344612 RepID=A1CGL1_ASPCL|nr:GNAT family acetyltransferase, putative [Aspergillus clavatus NRRL 1]EAW11091.1 GNAT family acetyltransferase, putative [Aspergillus clavatus NRRL 1]
MSYPDQAISVIIPQHIEVIQTPRLLLRPMRIGNDEDAAGVFSFRSRQDVVDWLWPRVTDANVEATKAWMTGKIFNVPDASGAVGRTFFFVIIPKENPQCIVGAVGVNSLAPAPSVGYAIHPSFWGKGYATEAVKGVIDAWWKLPRAEGMGQGEKLFAAVNHANKGSVKVLERNGFLIYENVELFENMVAFMHLENPNFGGQEKI